MTVQDMGPVSFVVEKSPRASPPRYNLCDSCPLCSETLPWDGPQDLSSEGCCCISGAEASAPVGPCFHGTTSGHHACGTRTTDDVYIQGWCITSCTARDPRSCTVAAASFFHPGHLKRLAEIDKTPSEPNCTESLFLGEVLGSQHNTTQHTSTSE